VASNNLAASVSFSATEIEDFDSAAVGKGSYFDEFGEADHLTVAQDRSLSRFPIGESVFHQHVNELLPSHNSEGDVLVDPELL
jgi:hypothetical protein